MSCLLQDTYVVSSSSYGTLEIEPARNSAWYFYFGNRQKHIGFETDFTRIFFITFVHPEVISSMALLLTHGVWVLPSKAPVTVHL